MVIGLVDITEYSVHRDRLLVALPDHYFDLLCFRGRMTVLNRQPNILSSHESQMTSNIAYYSDDRTELQTWAAAPSPTHFWGLKYQKH